MMGRKKHDNIIVKYNEKNIKINIRKTNIFSRFFGLMFKCRNSENLLFDFGREVRTTFHSILVFFPFLIIWLDSKNNILDYKLVRPFSFSIKFKKKFNKVIEIPINEKNEELIGKIRGI